MALCGRMEGGDHCPASGERRYMNESCCPCRKPAVPTPDPARTAAALLAGERPVRPARTYGRATTDPPRLRGDGITVWPVEDKSKGDQTR